MNDLVEERIVAGDVALAITRPADPESMLDEQAFERDEFLPYWAELWPSSIALADVVASLRLPGRSVLELGCGLGLPALVAAARGARVVAADWSDDAVALLARNATANGLRLRAVGADWRDGAALAGETFELILAADVLYEARNTAPLLTAIDRLLAPHGEALVADPGRHHAADFTAAAGDRGWQVEITRPPSLPGGVLHTLRRRE